MTYLTKVSACALALAAGVVMLGSAGSVPVQAKTIYYGETVSFRDAKRMCARIHGRVFLSEYDVYGCHGGRSKGAYIPPPPPPPPPGDKVPELFTIKKANSSGKRQNFAGDTFTGAISNHGGRSDGGNGGRGGGGNGGAPGGPN